MDWVLWVVTVLLVIGLWFIGYIKWVWKPWDEPEDKRSTPEKRDPRNPSKTFGRGGQ